MAPSADSQAAATHTKAQVKSENKQSIKVLESLLEKLTISKAQDEILGSSQEIALFINGDIEEQDAPVK